MNPRLTEASGVKGWVLFDGQCAFCTNLVRRFTPLLHRYHFELAPLQTPWVRERLAVTDKDLLSEMRFLTAQGEVHGGADALICIARQIWWSRPLGWLASLPLIRAGLHEAYRWIARHRHCPTGIP
jgi:predicted DCC family thiol-disulfide oxidoreductase YuxK